MRRRTGVGQLDAIPVDPAVDGDLDLALVVAALDLRARPEGQRVGRHAERG